MKHRSSPSALSAAFLTSAVVLAAAAFGPAAAGAAAKASVNVYQYAINNPVDDAKLKVPPTLGESVPRSVKLVPLDGDVGYAYFYYNGHPVIVDVRTRSVVRLGN